MSASLVGSEMCIRDRKQPSLSLSLPLSESANHRRPPFPGRGDGLRYSGGCKGAATKGQWRFK
eukprot:3507934-Alexandrium_andersonii.AAC.1